MDSLFEASFTTVASAGKPFSKCGKCNRYMKYIDMRPMRLYCPTCEVIYLFINSINIFRKHIILLPVKEELLEHLKKYFVQLTVSK